MIVSNESSTAEIKECEAKRKFRQDEVALGIRAVMSTKDGRGYIFDYLRSAEIFQTSFTGNSRTFFKEGKREKAFELWKDIQKHCKDLGELMNQEAKSKGGFLW